MLLRSSSSLSFSRGEGTVNSMIVFFGRSTVARRSAQRSRKAPVQYQPEHAAVKVRSAALAAHRPYNHEQQFQKLFQAWGSEHAPAVTTFDAQLPLVTTGNNTPAHAVSTTALHPRQLKPLSVLIQTSTGAPCRVRAMQQTSMAQRMLCGWWALVSVASVQLHVLCVSCTAHT
jgi:hypothetical protein